MAIAKKRVGRVLDARMLVIAAVYTIVSLVFLVVVYSQDRSLGSGDYTLLLYLLFAVVTPVVLLIAVPYRVLGETRILATDEERKRYLSDERRRATRFWILASTTLLVVAAGLLFFNALATLELGYQDPELMIRLHIVWALANLLYVAKGVLDIRKLRKRYGEQLRPSWPAV